MIGFAFVLLTLFTVGSLVMLNSNTTRQNKLEETVQLAAYQSLADNYTGEGKLTNDQIKSKFTKLIKDQYGVDKDGNPNAEITFVTVDSEKGILSVFVKTTYQNLQGKDITIKDAETVIYEEGKEN